MNIDLIILAAIAVFVISRLYAVLGQKTGAEPRSRQLREAPVRAAEQADEGAAEQDKRNAVELAQAQVASQMQKSAVAKDSEIQALKAKRGGFERCLFDNMVGKKKRLLEEAARVDETLRCLLKRL